MTQAKSVTDFRPDIEGLRALAMLAILVYHLDVNALTGGFSAVDCGLTLLLATLARIMTPTG